MEGRAINALMIYLFGGLALFGAVLMLFLREPMRVALALITTMVSLGIIYGLLGVHFIAAFQVLIYVGAVMVFMVYVIMLLEVREAPGSVRYSNLVVPGVVAVVALVGTLGISVWRGIGTTSGGVTAAVVTPTATNTNAYGMSEFSTAFLRDYWLPFELTTVLLVAAIVAALAVVKVSRRTTNG